MSCGNSRLLSVHHRTPHWYPCGSSTLLSIHPQITVVVPRRQTAAMSSRIHRREISLWLICVHWPVAAALQTSLPLVPMTQAPVTLVPRTTTLPALIPVTLVTRAMKVPPLFVALLVARARFFTMDNVLASLPPARCMQYSKSRSIQSLHCIFYTTKSQYNLCTSGHTWPCLPGTLSSWSTHIRAILPLPGSHINGVCVEGFKCSYGIYFVFIYCTRIVFPLVYNIWQSATTSAGTMEIAALITQLIAAEMWWRTDSATKITAR